MNYTYTFSIILLLSIVLAGCSTIDIEQTIQQNGETQITLQAQLTQSSPQIMQEFFNDICPALETKELSFTVLRCEIQNQGTLLIKLRGTIDEEYFEDVLISEQRLQYYNAQYIFSLLEEAQIEGFTFSQQELLAFTFFNPQIQLHVQMPNEIQESELGLLTSPNRISLNVLELAAQESGIITASREVRPNTFLRVLYFIVPIIFVLIIVTILIKINTIKFSKSQISSNTVTPYSKKNTLSKEELAAKEYILKYQTPTNKEYIKQEFIKSGIKPEVAQQYVSKYYKY